VTAIRAHVIAPACYTISVYADAKEVLSVFFFFQAEDGIRDRTVTGVQTCALPISFDDLPAQQHPYGYPAEVARVVEQRGWAPARSEERRVGKECRSRWAPDP